MTSDHFYSSIRVFPDFLGVTVDSNFHRVPSDWSVVVADIEGSTQAITSGRYKDVNTLGAASIVCGQNAMGELELPFVFGGDGATMIVPQSRLSAVTAELVALKALAEQRFGLGLRVGVVSVGELLADGVQLEVARFDVAGGRSIAIFRGGALLLAESKIKRDAERYCMESAEEIHQTVLSDLSCRWQAVPSRKGQVLSLLVAARGKDQEIYRSVLEQLASILGGELEAGHPIDSSRMRYKGFFQAVREESRLHDSGFSLALVKRWLDIALTVLVFRWGLPAFVFDAESYAGSIPVHSDYRKFDDALRMILDCTDKQANAIEAFLERERERGLLFYGIHRSDSSLMTCYVSSTAEGAHLHFVDGTDGGYAMAATHLKRQMGS